MGQIWRTAIEVAAYGLLAMGCGLAVWWAASQPNAQAEAFLQAPSVLERFAERAADRRGEAGADKKPPLVAQAERLARHGSSP